MLSIISGKPRTSKVYERKAQRYYTESLRLTRDFSTSNVGLPYLLDSLGKVALRHGKHEEARHYYTESLEYRKKNGNPREIADSLYQFGQLAHAEGEFEQSLRLFLKAASIYAETDATTSFYADAVNNAINALAAELGSEKIVRLKLETETRTLEEIVNMCLSR